MPTGLVALLDDISVIAKAAAATIDDVGVAAAGTTLKVESSVSAKVGAKAGAAEPAAQTLKT